MRKYILLWACFCVSTLKAATPQYVKQDSLKVVSWLQAAQKLDKNENLILHFARQFIGIPYVAQTLERNAEEQLVINLRELDCTTFVENVLALTACVKDGKTGFEDFCHNLRQIRYRDGDIAYTSRLHYFSEWIADNTKGGLVEEVQGPNPPFTAVQTLKINYMSRFPEKYPMLKGKPQRIKKIRAMENELNGKKFSYIPKTDIANTNIFRQAIQDGDIVAIITKREGLDTSHIGFAVWHKNGLHLLHASSLSKKVVEDKKTLWAYMKEQRMQQGIRIIRVKK